MKRVLCRSILTIMAFVSAATATTAQTGSVKDNPRGYVLSADKSSVLVPGIFGWPGQDCMGTNQSPGLLIQVDLLELERPERPPITAPCSSRFKAGPPGVYVHPAWYSEQRLSALGLRMDGLETTIFGRLKEITADDLLRSALDKMEKRVEQLESALAQYEKLDTRLKVLERQAATTIRKKEPDEQ
jgi:hypothetical protein